MNQHKQYPERASAGHAQGGPAFAPASRSVRPRGLRLLCAAALLSLGALGACDTRSACDQLWHTYQDRLLQCGFLPPAEGDCADGGDCECGERSTRLASCFTPCYRNAPCTALRPSTPEDEGVPELYACLQKCYFPEGDT